MPLFLILAFGIVILIMLGSWWVERWLTQKTEAEYAERRRKLREEQEKADRAYAKKIGITPRTSLSQEEIDQQYRDRGFTVNRRPNGAVEYSRPARVVVSEAPPLEPAVYTLPVMEPAIPIQDPWTAAAETIAPLYQGEEAQTWVETDPAYVEPSDSGGGGEVPQPNPEPPALASYSDSGGGGTVPQPDPEPAPVSSSSSSGGGGSLDSSPAYESSPSREDSSSSWSSSYDSGPSDSGSSSSDSSGSSDW